MIISRLKAFTRKHAPPRRGHSRDDRSTHHDRALARRLVDTFERGMELSDLRGIHFYVQGGLVTLYGTVRHDLDRELLLSFIQQIKGVTNVVDNLQLVDRPFREPQVSMG